jgi:hypothetical protein
MAKPALCIGINNYPGTDSELAGCVNDAIDWATAFQKHGFTVGTLLDKKASGQAIRNTIKSTLAKAKSGDLVVVQYSGYGFLCPTKSATGPMVPTNASAHTTSPTTAR